MLQQTLQQLREISERNDQADREREKTTNLSQQKEQEDSATVIEPNQDNTDTRAHTDYDKTIQPEDDQIDDTHRALQQDPAGNFLNNLIPTENQEEVLPDETEIQPSSRFPKSQLHDHPQELILPDVRNILEDNDPKQYVRTQI